MVSLRDDDDVYMDLSQVNEHALVCREFDSAYIGYTVGAGGMGRAVYDYDLCVDALIERDKMSPEEAVEYFEFNTLGAYFGENTPLFIVMRAADRECVPK